MRYARLDGKIVLGNGCTLGDPALAEAFLTAAAISTRPDDYPDGNAALMFVLRFFYEMIQNGKSVAEAFGIAQSMDDETSMYRLFPRSGLS